MAFHAVPNCIGIVLAGTVGGQELRHVLHAKAAAATPTGGELIVAADTVAAWAIASYKNKLHSSVIIQSVTAIDESQIDGHQVLGAGLLPVTGTLNSPYNPNNVTLAVSLRTALGGRSHRGRFYAWPTNSAQLDAFGGWTQAYADGMVTILNALITSMATATVPLAIKSNTLTTVTPITQAVLQDYVVDSQRRRLPGRGR